MTVPTCAGSCCCTRRISPASLSTQSSALPSSARTETTQLGRIVMEHLRQLDDVAYVRFASVYRNFREAKDFEAVLGELSAEDDARVATLRK